MKKARNKESQIVKILKEFKNGIDTNNLCRKYGMPKATFNNWRNKYSRIKTHQLQRIKELEEENRKLRKMYADISIDNAILKDYVVMLKNLIGACRT
ncbi:transposase [Carboxylicivirga sp. M1479]|uniref:transposase n=1 Tax=Carboxylicivirga sp. M1479 TaxID=2594476 RepID=UPI0011786F7E|nr:transposase [Carboxylicivirga sp. M1479]TRX71951.1 transposase [Carboxylicivirga sp. M1479]